jgi:hypothetical protein
MTNLASFAELMKQAAADKAARALAEEERKKTEVAPLLSELFATVSKAKVTEEKRKAVVQKVDELEANQITEDDVTELVTEKLGTLATDSEKKLAAVVRKLQEDIANLKRHVDASNRSSGWGGATAGSGEVRILRMDDIDLTGMADGKVLAYSQSAKKIVFIDPTTGGTTTTTDEEMPYSKRIDFISDNEMYKAEAAVGSPENSPVWRIRKVTLATDNDVAELWANGSAAYDKRWDNRASYTYS